MSIVQGDMEKKVISIYEKVHLDINRLLVIVLLLPPAMKLGQGNIFRSVCQEFCPQGVGVHGRGGMHVAGGHVWQGHVWQGGMYGRGACVAGGHVWQGGVHGRGACVAGGYAWWGCLAGGHVWWGACMAGGHAWQIL